MATEAERIRQEIAATRAELARDVDRLAQHSAPRGLTGWVTSRLRTVKDHTIGSSERAASTVAGAASGLAEGLHHAGEGAAETLHEVGEALQQAPRQVARATQGSPIGVGLIAFGGGMLAAALIPETEAERRVAREVAEHAGPIVAPLREGGRAVGADVREAVGAAGDQVRTVAAEAVGHVQSVAAEGVEEVRTAASDGVSDVRAAVPATPEQVRRDT